MMKKTGFFLTIMFLLTGLAAARPVDVAMARRVAETYMQAQGMRNTASLVDVTAETPFTAFYVFAAPEGGFILVSGDDAVIPVLGYSVTSRFETEDIPVHVMEWLKGYEKEIGRVSGSQSSEIDGQWKMLQGGEMPPAPLTTDVLPLLTTSWGQRPYYNRFCPYDSSADTLVPAGCVATATAQVMKYWAYPDTGYGSHTYTSQRTNSGVTYTYPNLTANFGATAYQWSLMPTALTSVSGDAEINAVATLMYHIGVAVEMKYSPTASGSNNYYTRGTVARSAQAALMKFFKYRADMYPIMRADYGDAAFSARLRGELEQQRPILFRGGHTSGSHSFVLDGYDNNNMFHVNWGWRGSYNGYFAMGALNPYGGGDGSNGSGTYNLDNVALLGIQPYTDWSTSGLTTVTATAVGGGSVSGSGTYTFGDTVSLLATANAGCRFSGWSDGSKFNPREIVANGGSYSFMAIFDSIVGDTLHYCPGNHNITSYGYSSGGNNYWGIRLPSTMLGEVDTLKAVQLFVTEAGTYDLTIYTGTSHTIVAATDTVTFTSDNNDQWQTVALSTPVPANDDLWLIFHYYGTGYPQSATYYGGAAGSFITGSNFEDKSSSRNLSAMVKGIFSHRPPRYAVTVNRVCHNCSEEIPADYVTGEGTYHDGDSVSLEGRVQGCDLSFGYWITADGDTLFDNPYSFVIHSDRTFTAVFAMNGGIDNVEGMNIRLYPNPAGDRVVLEGIVGKAEVTVADLVGRVLFKQTVDEGNNILDVSALPAGVYMVRVGAVARKVVKK